MRSRKKSTAPVQQQLLPPPMPFDESDGWRRTMLYRVTDPLERDVLLRLSKMLDHLILEVGSFWRHLEESGTAAEARAAAADLRYLQVFLARFDPGDFDRQDDPVEYRLCRLARRLAPRVAKIAAELEMALERPAEGR